MNRSSTKLHHFRSFGLNFLIVGILTGLFAGTIVTFYNVLAHLFEGYSVDLYSLVRENPAFIPLLFIGLCAGALVIGTLVKFVPMIRGSGIPQIEGAARGLFPFKWFTTLCSMFAASLACIALGLSAGAEGPSIEIGGSCGYGSGVLLRRSLMVRRMQTAAGASAGFAVAFNSPVTGMIFALEEAFRSFSPQVFISSAISVAVAILTRGAFAQIGELGINRGFAFSAYSFSSSLNAWDGSTFSFCGFALLAAVAAGLFGVAFYHVVFLAKKLFSKLKFLRGVGKYIIPFALAGAFGLITPYAMGGGSSFISALATGGSGVFSNISVLGAGLVASVIIITLIKFVASALAMGCGVPCGVFIPMLATGAGLGAALSFAFVEMGMPAELSDYLIMITMAAFFTAVVKAPVTALVMIFELTGDFTNVLPALLGVAAGYAVSELFRLKPIYEKCLGMFVAEEKVYSNVKKERVTVKIQPLSYADGKTIRSIVWPTDGLVVGIVFPDGSSIVPDGETVLHAGDTITFECDTDSRAYLMEYLYDICGKP